MKPCNCIRRVFGGAVLVGMTTTLALLWGCQAGSGPQAASGAKAAATPDASPSTQPLTVASKTGVQLWAENCNRCHNIRDPGAFSDAQWSVVTRHMRLRANLTGSETHKILEFLKTANKSG